MERNFETKLFFGILLYIFNNFQIWKEKKYSLKLLPLKRQGLVEINEQHRSKEMRQIHDTIYNVCGYLQEDNPPASASGLSPAQTKKNTITFLLHQHAFVLLQYEILDLTYLSLASFL